MSERKLVYEDDDFRRYESEIVTDKDGNKKEVTECEELMGGRWEGFVSVRKIKK